VNVELAIFSGRPNPSWQLSAREINELTSRLSGLPPFGLPGTASALGYRGFIVSNPEESGGLPARIQVYNGIVSVERSGQMNFYQDANHLERWLLDCARSHGYGSIIDQLIDGGI